jgi:taurine dioxygenase
VTSTPLKTDLDVRPVTGYTGAEIHGVDLSRGIDDELAAAIKEVLNTYGVIFFRGQELTPDEYVDFGSTFGTVTTSRAPLPTVEENPLINALIRQPDAQPSVVGGTWHADQTYREEPTFGTILYAKQVPPFGADTAYINMQAAYDALSDGLKETLAGMRGVHVHAHNMRGRTAEEIAARPSVASHPVVLEHPENGRKTLYVSPGYTQRFEGWTEEESQPLLNFLCTHALRPEFGCRFRWETGSIAFWDNRQVWHYAVNDTSGHLRVMHRLVVG